MNNLKITCAVAFTISLNILTLHILLTLYP